jgi:hypothetical protein
MGHGFHDSTSCRRQRDERPSACAIPAATRDEGVCCAFVPYGVGVSVLSCEGEKNNTTDFLTEFDQPTFHRLQSVLYYRVVDVSGGALVYYGMQMSAGYSTANDMVVGEGRRTFGTCDDRRIRGIRGPSSSAFSLMSAVTSCVVLLKTRKSCVFVSQFNGKRKKKSDACPRRLLGAKPDQAVQFDPLRTAQTGSRLETIEDNLDFLEGTQQRD